MKKIFLLYLLLLTISTHSALGTKIYSRNYSINDGLPNNTINDIYKDTRGFLWIGTNAGLVRFDGVNFKNYTSLNGLASDYVISICESNKGEIWLGCKNEGITSIIGDQIYSLTYENGLVSNKITKLYFSKKFNLLFVGTEEGLSVLNDGKKININRVGSNEDYKLHITDFIETDEYIYVFTQGGLAFKYNPFLENLSPLTANHFLARPMLQSAFISKNDEVFLNQQNNFYLENKNIIDEIGVITDYKEDLDGNIWISTIKNTHQNIAGLYKYSQGNITKYDQVDFKDDDILALEFDHQENILWIGTKNQGLYLLPDDKFVYYDASFYHSDHLHVIDLETENDDIWICMEQSVIRQESDGKIKKYAYATFKNTFDEYAKSKIKKQYQYLIDPKGSFNKYEDLISKGKYHYSNPYLRYKNGIEHILEPGSLYKPLKHEVLTHKELLSFTGIIGIKEKNIWIGSNVGVFILNTLTDELKYIDLEGSNFSQFAFNKQNQLIASSWNELLIYHNIDKKPIIETFDFYTDNSPTNISKALSADDQIWFSSYDHGLFVYQNNKFINSDKQNIINTNAFNDICIDRAGNIIAAGNNGKIYIVDVKNDTIYSKLEIGSEQGIKGSTIRWIYPAKSDILYVGTNAGINALNLESLFSSGLIDIQYLNKDHGLTDYSGHVAVVDTNQQLWIGTNSQLIRKSLKKTFHSTNAVNYYIESIEVENEKLAVNHFGNSNDWNLIPSKNIQLPYNKNSISFYFNPIHFLDPHSVLTSYKLEGSMDDWTKPYTNQKIEFQNLPSGKYLLRIKIYNQSVLASSQELSISFTINHPYWKKWYFIALGIIALAGLVIGFIQLRTNTIRKRERLRMELAERISQFEMKALRAQMNPHFIFNAINSIQNYMLDNDVDTALNYLSDFAKLIRITLDNVSKKKVELEDELNYLKYYLSLEKMRYDKSFETEIILPKEISARKIMIPPMIIQPYIENAIKYGFIFKTNNAKIKLEFKITHDEILHCIIEDNGIGRKKSKELSKNSKTGKSKATFITNERLVLLNQIEERKDYKTETIDLYDQYGIASGTRVVIDLPL